MRFIGVIGFIGFIGLAGFVGFIGFVGFRFIGPQSWVSPSAGLRV